MSLKIKLPLFIVLVVFVASIAILVISVYQTKKRGESDVAQIRINETARAKNAIKEHVAIMYSLISAQYQRSISKEEMATILNKVKDVTYDNGRGYFWVCEAGGAPKILVHPYLDSLDSADRGKLRSYLYNVNNIVEKFGDGFIETAWPRFSNNKLADSAVSKFCYARMFKPLGWIVASGRSTDDIDAIITIRTRQTEHEIASIVHERVLFAIVILALSFIVVVLFSNLITGPINKLVYLTEEITSERKGFSERIIIRSRDEIGRLARSFNLLLGHIQSTLAKLEENGRKYRELVENANSAIIRIDIEGNIHFFNEYAQRLFGFSKEEIQGKTVTDIYTLSAGTKQSEKHSLLKEVLSSPEITLYSEEEIITKDGNKKWLAWTNRPIYDENGMLKEILCVGSDISARKSAEKLAHLQQQRLIQTDKMTTLGVLVSGIAHEINNPNNFIILNGENLSEIWKDILPVLDEHFENNQQYRMGGLPYGEMRKELPGLLHGINEGARRIKRIVQNLKDFARQEPGDINQWLQMRQVVDAATVIVGNLIKKSTNNFEVVQIGKVPDVKGNFQRLEQVIINLVTNACEATNTIDEPITVTITHDRERQEVAVAVRDYGQGIPAENMKYIMDPFFTTKRDKGGTGLGLAISYTIVKDHGGDLRIESVPGKGATATIVLPAFGKDNA